MVPVGLNGGGDVDGETGAIFGVLFKGFGFGFFGMFGGVDWFGVDVEEVIPFIISFVLEVEGSDVDKVVFGFEFFKDFGTNIKFVGGVSGGSSGNEEDFEVFVEGSLSIKEDIKFLSKCSNIR